MIGLHDIPLETGMRVSILWLKVQSIILELGHASVASRRDCSLLMQASKYMVSHSHRCPPAQSQLNQRQSVSQNLTTVIHNYFSKKQSMMILMLPCLEKEEEIITRQTFVHFPVPCALSECALSLLCLYRALKDPIPSITSSQPCTS